MLSATRCQVRAASAEWSPPLAHLGAAAAAGAPMSVAEARFDELGWPCKLALNFDLTKGRYVSVDYA